MKLLSGYLFIYYCLFLWVLFVVPTIKTRKKTGINPMQLSKTTPTISYVAKVYQMINSWVFLIIIINAFLPKLMNYFVPILYLEIHIFHWIGVVLIHLAFLFIFIAQRNMGVNWRVRIDNDNKVNLVTKGLFSVSRNPVFCSVILLFIGLFLIIPNLVTAVILVAGIIVINVQVRLEEEFLTNEFGDAYLSYAHKVRRWL